MRYRSKTLSVLKTMFKYEPDLNGSQGDSFKEVTKQIRKIQGNEFDAAVAFMFTQIESGSGFEGGDNDWKLFRKQVLTDAAYCSDHAALEITKETANELFEAYWETEQLEEDTDETNTPDFDELITAISAALLVSKEFMQKSSLCDVYIQSDEAFGYVSGFIDGYLQTRTQEFLEQVGKDEVTITNTVLSIVFKDLDFDINYLPIDRLSTLQKSRDHQFIAAMASGGNAAFAFMNTQREEYNHLHWLDHFEEYTANKTSSL